MSKPLLVIVTGLPATGKTTLACHIAAGLRLPFAHKDGIKESLFETLGWSDLAWSQRLGRASTELLYYFAEAQLRMGKSCVVESNFDPALAAPKFVALKSKHDFNAVQIVCMADPRVIWERYQARWMAGQKHPGHVQHLDPRGSAWVHSPQGKAAAMDLGGPVLEVDTTDFSQINVTALIETIKGVGA